MSAPEAINRSGLSDDAIAAQMSCDPSTVWRWRKGKVPPHRDAVSRLSEVLKCSPEELRPDWAAVFANGNGKARRKRAK